MERTANRAANGHSVVPSTTKPHPAPAHPLPYVMRSQHDSSTSCFITVSSKQQRPKSIKLTKTKKAKTNNKKRITSYSRRQSYCPPSRPSSPYLPKLSRPRRDMPHVLFVQGVAKTDVVERFARHVQQCAQKAQVIPNNLVPPRCVDR